MTLPGLQPPATTFSTDTQVIVIGAGLAGCAVARALVNAGYRCRLYDRHLFLAGGTSAVPCALVRPQVTKTRQVATQYFGEAFDRMHGELKGIRMHAADVAADVTGALQLVKDASQWPNHEYYRSLTVKEASDIAGVPLASDALYFDQAGWLDIASLCRHWINQCEVINKNSIEYSGATDIRTLQKTHDGWQLLGASNKIIDQSHLVIIASAEVAGSLTQTSHLPLQQSRGQLSHFRLTAAQADSIPKTIITGKGSVIPDNDGIWAGSTHHRNSFSTAPSPVDDIVNLQNAIGLCPQLGAAFDGVANTADNHADKNSGSRQRADQSWVGFRYSTPDRLPLIGGAPIKEWYQQQYADLRHGRRQQQFPSPRFHDGLYLATGFGSRGALHSIYASELLVAMISGTLQSSQSFDNTVCRLLHPGRFIVRQLRRGL